MLRELQNLRVRLDALREGRVADPGVIGRALAFFVRVDQLPKMNVLSALDRDLDRVGIHTAGDALLLKSLSVQKGRAAELAKGLGDRAEEAVNEFEQRVRQVEIAQLADSVPRGAVSELERAYLKLSRAVKVADIFRTPQGSGQIVPFEILRPQAQPDPAAAAPPSSARVAIAQFWTERARANATDVVQKRRDLDLAHEMLLRSSSEADRDRVRNLRMEVSSARDRARALPPVRSLNELVKHVRTVARRDPGSAYQSLRGLYENAVEANDPELARMAHDALTTLLPDRSRLASSIERSERLVAVNWTLPSAVQWEKPKSRKQTEERGRADELLAQLAWNLSDEQLQAFELAAGCARYFDVEDTLAEEVMEVDPGKLRTVQRRVPYPTQTMTFERASGLHEFENFVIEDPRRLVYDLASNRQQVRTYLEEEPPPKPKKIRKTAVRVYVCDASGSMHGARARFRDAIMIAELNNLRVKARRGQPFDPLYFCYFNDEPTELTRVENAGDATEQLHKLFAHSPAEGQTDITLALVSAFQQIRSAQGHDPYLARATVVLITDGEDRVDKEQIRREREPVESVAIQLSFISLGDENQDLKALVDEQRSKGGRAFYHHLSDREIAAARTEFDTSFRTLLPRELEANAAAIETLQPHLDALVEVARGKAVSDKVKSALSFDAIFPDLTGKPGHPRQATEDEVARCTDMLDAVAEAASLAPPDARPTEAVVLLQHLLDVYGVNVTTYASWIEQDVPKVREALDRVRLLCRPFE